MEPEGAGPQVEDDCAATGDRTVASAAAMTDAKVLTTILGSWVQESGTEAGGLNDEFCSTAAQGGFRV
jgi:hypothetical protein